MCRTGKTYLLKSIVDDLISSGVNKNNIISISFENIEYKNVFTEEQLDDIILNRTKNLDGKIYLLFDEIQQVNSGERCVNAYRVNFDVDIYITGSNSKLISNELVTLLSGRYIKINLYPFSFKDILAYKEGYEGTSLSKETIWEIFEEYLLYGGMLGILGINDVNSKINVISDFYGSIIIHDVLSRYQIKDVDLFKRFVEYLMNSVGQTFSKTSITNSFER